MKKFILICLFSVLFGVTAYAQGWSTVDEVDEYREKVMRVITYKSTERTKNNIPVVSARYVNGSLYLTFIYNDISRYEYTMSTQYDSDRTRKRVINGVYRYSNDAKDFVEYKLNADCIFCGLGYYLGKYYVGEIFSIPITVKLMDRSNLIFKYVDVTNKETRIVRIPLEGFITEYNKLYQ